MQKPKILVSKCLNSNPCRYSGDSSENKIIPVLKNHILMSEVCPEVEIGLSTPRNPIRIEQHGDEIKLVESDSKTDYTDKMVNFSSDYITNIDDIDGFILKSRSPSCGVKNVKLYNKDSKISISKSHTGFFSKQILEKYSHLPIEDEGRLKNYSIRDNFLTKVFTIRNLKNSHNLNEFNENNKMLLSSYNKDLYETLSQRLVTENIDKNEYENEFYKIIFSNRDKENKTKVVQEIFNRYSKQLEDNEIQEFKSLIKNYDDNKIPFSSLAVALRMFAVRFKDNYIMNQTFFNPYPIELVNVSDSGKGRNL